MRSARAISYAVQCPKCDHRTPATVAWLIRHNELACGSGDCDVMIDLQVGEAATVIAKLKHACQEIDATLAKISAP